ncbi:MAG: hypothetical protein J0I34_33095 [Pseudonocardia sp.]|uniref:DUF6191 domain-containing protein n=1 Tax=unclassified Pseudonocardia TaxID=2619320 RepID=UPI00086A61DF|nr:MULTISPECIES: DUF6191 domain-containing protein [unclassified Pseudonocardia]MBN9113603.1 hypothetical protein [Pseudonocardia sp.]ODU25175.1 MAG: hypothetical protein ABS80_10605 [Pseudonocardia sp. SCN 72-51]ODV00048.1 MAG: hypothetical protein ABT15_30485 [Pseudonocardia sp. SCN 73-27]
MGQIWALAVAGVVLLLMVLAVADHIGHEVNGRSWLPWRRHRTTRVTLATGLDQVTALFYATKHHELDQHKTEIMMRDETPDGAPPAFTIRLPEHPSGIEKQQEHPRS